MTAAGLTIPATLTRAGRAYAVSYLRSYFAPVTSASGYTGSRFERLGGGGDRPAVAHEFTPEDLVAVTLLSVEVPGRAALEILERRRSRLLELLRQIPTDLDLVDVEPDALRPEWAPWRLETELRSITGLGPTTVSKLLARKRPRLIPVYDSVVQELVKPVGGFWASMNAALRADGCALQKHLIDLREELGIGEDISPLRIFDVVAWRTGKDASARRAASAINPLSPGADN
ncbi:DUF6308 family protein [Cellulomonas cellasea]|uniref:DUF6308 family protein n=1 Tax=Cellulomonas cellasea TaxID=43670 RepID=UPI0025A3164A|nr:DUF6308 family protein [Cellulomonas cellasea]MDM8084883.1 DUF6308 family protein [Cellulomonas cellasea]